MGKGDKKTKKGKITMGSYGKSRLTQKLKAKKIKVKPKKARKKAAPKTKEVKKD